MIALGVDPGTRNLGWGVVARSGNRISHVAHGVIHMGRQRSLSARLGTIFDQLCHVVAEHRPEVGAVEGLFFDKNAQSAATLGHARGVVLLCLERSEVAVVEHAPARVKRALVGNGRAEKGQVAKMVTAILGLSEAPPSDAADALALAITQLRLDPQAAQMDQMDKRRRSSARSKMPEHLAAAVARAQAERGR